MTVAANIEFSADGTEGRIPKQPIIVYEDNDCLGPPYMQISGSITYDCLYGFGYPVNTRYFFSMPPRVEGLVISSFLDTNGVCHNEPESVECCQTIEVLAEDIPFTLPVALPLRYEMD